MARPYRRIVVRSTLFVAIGALISVLVAWACAFAHFDAARDGDRVLQPDPRATVTWATEPPPVPTPAAYMQRIGNHKARSGLRVQSDGHLGRDENSAVFEQYKTWTLATGWPEPCMRVRVVDRMLMVLGNPPTATLTRWQDGALVPSIFRRGDRWPMPLRPDATGLAANAVFWGGIAFALWTVPGVIRRSIRRRRRKCVRCGYGMLGMSVCPECGLTSS